jgi:hypothetical protein
VRRVASPNIPTRRRKGLRGRAAALHCGGLRCATAALRCSVLRPRCATRCVHCVHSAQTSATSMMTTRAAREAASPALLGATEARRDPPAQTVAARARAWFGSRDPSPLCHSRPDRESMTPFAWIPTEAGNDKLKQVMRAFPKDEGRTQLIQRPSGLKNRPAGLAGTVMTIHTRSVMTATLIAKGFAATCQSNVRATSAMLEGQESVAL